MSSETPLVRLNKYLADRGVASRRKCDELIAGGKVLVDGEPVTELGSKVDPEVNVVEVDGRVFKPGTSRHRYYLLNKPKGVVCTNDRREAKKRAIDLITDPDAGRIYTVGRLDEESTGLILLTNDGDFTNLIAHPRHEVPKTYLVKVRGRIETEPLEKLRKGVHLAEGRTGPIKVRVLKRTSHFSSLSVTLAEGKNREVRRVFARVGFNVIGLRRTRIGNLSDRRLKEGQWRPLRRREVDDLIAVARGEKSVEPERGGRRRPPHKSSSRKPVSRKPSSRKPGGKGPRTKRHEAGKRRTGRGAGAGGRR
jgi:23S rRNA pseudouridine2605 synthase